jgi:DnaJ-class molecular chaperone
MSDAHDRKQPAAGRAHKASSSSGDGGEKAGPTTEESHDRSAAPPAEPVVGQRVCVPCHGTGKVISNLGGHARKVTCPWCRGGGERLTGVDAQEWQREQATLKRR